MKIRLGIVMCFAGMAPGQAFAPTGSLTFEVASIRPTMPGAEEGGLHPAPGGKRYVGANWLLRDYLSVAYQVKPSQIVGGPGWVDSEPYDLNAEAERPSSIEDLHIMLQNLLTERFKLQFHRETKEMQAHFLSVNKDGPKNMKVRENPSGGDQNFNIHAEQFLHETWTARCASMDYFTFVLSRLFDRPIINQTNIAGCFDFEVKFTQELPLGMREGQVVNGVPIDASGPTIYQALTNQLGLKVESRKGPVQTLVIDRAERPAAD